MSKRNLLNLILLIVIIILVAFVVFEPGKDQAIIPVSLTSLKADDIHHIKISRQATSAFESELEFKKTATGWTMLKPYQHTANSFRINSLLELLSTTTFSQNDLSNLNKSTFGLQPPRASIILNNKNSIHFGHNKSLKNHRYIQIENTLHMTADTFFYQLAAKAESYLNHKLLPDNSKIIKLSIPGMTLTKTETKWLIKPETTKHSADSINALISEWQLSQAFDVTITKPQADSNADISVYFANNKMIRFKIIGSTEKFILFNIDSGIRYTLSKDRQEKLLKLKEIDS